MNLRRVFPIFFILLSGHIFCSHNKKQNVREVEASVDTNSMARITALSRNIDGQIVDMKSLIQKIQTRESTPLLRITAGLVLNSINSIELQQRENTRTAMWNLRSREERKKHIDLIAEIIAHYEYIVLSQKNVCQELIKGLQGSDSALEDANKMLEKQMNTMKPKDSKK